ncbi:MAG: universal stress protein [Rhodospirillaceae bacterium]|nr:universal stress protein [Rhodospirillaceae bacterium]
MKPRAARRPEKSTAIRSILFATDLSERSDRAFARAVALAREHGAKLTVVHVVEGELPVALVARRRDEASQIVAAELSALQPRLKVELTLETGDPYAAILQCAKSVDADLIVLGRHRARPLVDLFVGTTVERVIRLGALPVLVVRNRVSGPYASAVAAVDFSPASTRALEIARAVAPRAALTLAHAYHIPFVGFLGSAQDRKAERDMHERRLAQLLAELGKPTGKRQMRLAPPVMKEGEVARVIAGAARKTGAELLVLGTHGKSAVAAAVLGSLATAFLNDPPCDVLAVPMR